MKKHKLLLSILSLSLFIPSTTYADCTKEEIDNFKEIEDEYKITYEFDKDTKTYTLTFYSPEPDMYDYILHIGKDKKCNEIEEKKNECYGIYPGEYIIDIVGQTNSCKDILSSKSLKLPAYNKYSEDPLCEGIEEFVLCQSTYDKDIDYDTFVSRVNTYKKNHTNKDDTDNQKEEIKEQNKILQYIQDNLLQIIIITIFIVMVITTIILTAKSIKKSRRLE